MASIARSIVLKTSEALFDANTNPEIIGQVKRQFDDDLELLNEILKTSDSITDQRTVSTAISEMNQFRYRLNEILISTGVNDANLPSTLRANQKVEINTPSEDITAEIISVLMDIEAENIFLSKNIQTESIIPSKDIPTENIFLSKNTHTESIIPLEDIQAEDIIVSKDFKPASNILWKDIQSAFENQIQTGVMTNDIHIDPKRFLNDCRRPFKTKIDMMFKEMEAFKVNAVLRCESKVVKNEEEQFKLNYVDTKVAPLYKYDDFDDWYIIHMQEPLLDGLEEYQRHDSGWTLSGIIDLRITISKFTMLMGSSFIELPDEIMRKKACINVRNKDDACFAWAIVSALYPRLYKSNHITAYPHYESVLHLKGIQFPMTIKQIPNFESQNNMSINVFLLKLNSDPKKPSDKFITIPTYVSKDKKEKHVNLLLIQNKYTDKSDTELEDDEDLEPVRYHYVWIKNLRRLLSSQLSRNGHVLKICIRCLRYFSQSSKLTEHQEQCTFNNIGKIRLPSRQSKTIAFKNYMRKKKAPFVIYADIECLSNDSKGYQNRVPFNIAYYVKCSYDPTLSFYRSHRGEDCTRWFTSELLQFAENLETVFLCGLPKKRLTAKQKKMFNDPKTSRMCYVCEKPFTKLCKKVANHCRFTGEFRGPAHEICNMNFRDHRIIPIFFDELSVWDSFYLFESFQTDFDGRIDVNTITSNETFITFTKFTTVTVKFRLIDSSQFMNDNLDTIASYMTTFPNIKSEMCRRKNDEKLKLLTRKPVYLDHTNLFSETTLPPISEFPNVTPSDYEHARKVWNEFHLKTLGEYSDFRLKTNVLLLADVFEEFRDGCLKNYELDLTYYHTLSAYAWDVMLRHTKVSLELLTDLDMVMFIERGIRGGLSQCSMRHSKANNKYLEHYNSLEPSKYLMHFDINNQYDWAMSQPLPCGKFTWVAELNNFDVDAISDESSVGYVLEVDLEYPSEIHDLHRDLPFCPEYQSTPDTKAKTNLVATMHPKVKYVIHYRCLKQALKHGLRLIKIHRALQFEQSQWLKSYIELNNNLSVLAKNDFERNLFEQMNYGVFEKFTENSRDDCKVRSVTKWPGRFGAESMICKQTFKSAHILNDQFAYIVLNTSEICFNKPFHVGMCILDLAKTRVYDFHYQCMQDKFNRNCNICYIDRDSILYEIRTKDIYESISEDCEQQFGIGDDDDDDEMLSVPQNNVNALGLVKDRNSGRVVKEFAGLRSQMYAVRLDERMKPMTLKGVPKDIVVNRIQFTDYKNCLENKKISLSPYDNKRYLVEGSCKTLPWGHYSLPKT